MTRQVMRLVVRSFLWRKELWIDSGSVVEIVPVAVGIDVSIDPHLHDGLPEFNGYVSRAANAVAVDDGGVVRVWHWI